jgi:ribosomal protein S18 acetylase RimI-like enzyme
VIRLRPFRNSDPPALAALWNRALPERHVVRPLSAYEFDSLVCCKLGFERESLIVAEDESGIVGFSHSGFGPKEPAGSSHKLDTSMGTIAMLAVAPDIHDSSLAQRLVDEAVSLLVRRGAQVVYAGGRYPVNPFYWGLYGGSELAGVLGADSTFHDAVRAYGFVAVSISVFLEIDVSLPEPFDPRVAQVKRSFRVETEEGALLPGWWESLALEPFRPTRFQLTDKQTGHVAASCWTWEIALGMAVEDGYARTGLINLEVEPAYRRKGLARLLISECFKHARTLRSDRLCVQTLDTNLPALALYLGRGFERVEHATLYRLNPQA